MVQLISWGIALFIVFGIPYMMEKKAESKRREELYRPKTNGNDTDVWSR